MQGRMCNTLTGKRNKLNGKATAQISSRYRIFRKFMNVLMTSFA